MDWVTVWHSQTGDDLSLFCMLSSDSQLLAVASKVLYRQDRRINGPSWESTGSTDGSDGLGFSG